MNTNVFNKRLKEVLHEAGLNIIVFNEKKIPVDENGAPLRGAIVYAHQDLIDDYVMRAKRWGVRPSKSSKCDNIMFLDWDDVSTKPPSWLMDIFQAVKARDGGYSYHGIVRVIGANTAWCENFVKINSNKVKGFELFFNNHNLCMRGSYVTKNGKTASWFGHGGDLRPAVMDIDKQVLENRFSNVDERTHPGSVRIPAGQGLRHGALISAAFKIGHELTSKELANKQMAYDILYAKIIASNTIEGMDEYSRGSSRYAELESIINYVLENLESSPAHLAFDLVCGRHNWAHITGQSEKEQYNCYVYENHRWQETAGHTILKELEKIPFIKGLKPSSTLATETARLISASAENCVQVTMDDEYRKSRNNMVIDPYGQYFDLKEGKIKYIDPSNPMHFFFEPDVRYKLIDCEDPEEYIEYLQSMFKDDWIIVLNQQVMAFLHGSAEVGRRKMLFVIGKTLTGKSFLIETVFVDLFTDARVSNVSMRQLDDDSVFGPATIVNRMVNYQEEASPKLPRNHTVLKDLITKNRGSARRMRSTKTITAERWPIWIVACNVVPPIGNDDDDESIFERMMYVEVVGGEMDPKWREIFRSPEMKSRILICLLRRAHGFIKDPSSLDMQDRDEARRRYEDLRGGPILQFLRKTCVTREQEPWLEDNLGVGFLWLFNQFKRSTKTNMSRRAFESALADLGYEKHTRQWCVREPVTNGVETYRLCPYNEEGAIQHTLIMGLRTKIKNVESTTGAQKKLAES